MKIHFLQGPKIHFLQGAQVRSLLLATAFLTSMHVLAQSRNILYSTQVRSLVATVNSDWLSPAVMQLDNGEVLHVSFDELSHTYHRYIYHLTHCEFDWSPSESLFENDYIQGFNDNPIEDYTNSLNTTVPYTHYKLQIPNDRCKLTLSGNYILTIIDEDHDDEKVAEVRFMVLEDGMNVGLSATTNTDVDHNDSHQQLSMEVNYNSIPVTNLEEQIQTIITQNNRDDNRKINIRPNLITNKGLTWQHNRNLIFNAGNEYRKYEILDVSHPTMGIDRIEWDGHHYHAYPVIDEPRYHYLTDEDADGGFFIRNSDNLEIDYTCDYVTVEYQFKTPKLPQGQMVINGQFTTDANPDNYVMTYNETDGCYHAAILQKQGYYNYQYLQRTDDGQLYIPPTEGSFYQTENRYQGFVYYKGTGERTWRLVGYRQLIMK